MKLGTIILGIVIVLAVGGFGFLAVSEPPVATQSVTKTIPNERFFNGN